MYSHYPEQMTLNLTLLFEGQPFLDFGTADTLAQS